LRRFESKMRTGYAPPGIASCGSAAEAESVARYSKIDTSETVISTLGGRGAGGNEEDVRRGGFRVELVDRRDSGGGIGIWPLVEYEAERASIRSLRWPMGR
jgi:hypothetical protein